MTSTPPTRRLHRQAAPGDAQVRTDASPEQPETDAIPLATMSRPPRRTPAIVTAAPMFAPAPVETPPAGYTPVRVGWEAGRGSLASTPGPIRPLETSADVLPELTESVEKPRPLWRHPASLVSIATTLLALIALAVFLVIGMLNPGAAATGLGLSVSADNVRATWSGPDVPYQLLVVGGPGGDTVDVSQLVTGEEAWIPLSAGLIDERSCVVVRPATASDQPVALDAEALSAQGAASACVADAQAASADD
ncbi:MULTISPECIES: hypothetical protein [Microbacterium]|uniref:hypothetical protein n=1 Tax=Microbacterium TaxID=33882 RepID=UPI000D641CC3|nr:MULTISPECIES: hypothetical protein [Microbacterium]